MPIKITKSSGEVVPFEQDKVLQSILRTGASQEIAKQVLSVVKKSLRSKMPTSEIYQIARSELAKRTPWAAARYNLRDAILRMGPGGFNFEKYVAAVLTAYGYKTELPETLQGACIPHEIDVTAEKDGRTAFIEAKFRLKFTEGIVIKDVLATWSRFLDLVDGAKIGVCPHFDEAWIVTNAGFTDQSIHYAECKNMRLIGWNYPKERTFARMVDTNALYPITLLHDLKQFELDAFANSNIMLCRELEPSALKEIQKKTGIPKKRLEELAKVCQQVVQGSA